MRTRMILPLAGALLGALALGGAGMALAWGHSGTAPWNNAPGAMMGGQPGHSSMMGSSSGHGSMMGGQYGAQPGTTAQATPVTGVTHVQMASFAFVPANIEVPVGTTVTWTNQDTAPHTVTFRDDALKSSSILRQGESYSYTFTKPGTYTYYCTVHPTMTAQVVVTP